MSKISTSRQSATPRRMARPWPAAHETAQAETAEHPAEGSSDEPGTSRDPQAPAASTARPPRPPSKQEAVLALLVRDEGATLDEMMATTGWLAHSTRAVIKHGSFTVACPHMVGDAICSLSASSEAD